MTRAATGRLRLFAALDLPAEPRAALAAFRDAAVDPAAWRPVPDAALHVTLAFLGHRPSEDAAVVAEVIARLEEPPAPGVRAGAPLLLPPRRPRVLAVALEDPAGELARLHGQVAEGLAAEGVYVPERRRFRPHVTLARLRSGAAPPAAPADGPGPLSFTGAAVTLYESRLGPGGARYEPLFTRSLG